MYGLNDSFDVSTRVKRAKQAMDALHFFASERSRIDMNPASNLREVTVAFRKLARIYHSDKWGKKKVDEKFKTISYAYDDFKISNTSIGNF